MQSPASEQSIAQLRRNSEKELNARIPDEYINFLKLTNGLDYNGLIFFACETVPIEGFNDRFIEGLVEANLAMRDVERFHNFIVFGDSGESLYVQKPDTGEYLCLDTISLDQFECFHSFEEMLRSALEAHS